jgi:hypothetical protein
MPEAGAAVSYGLRSSASPFAGFGFDGVDYRSGRANDSKGLGAKQHDKGQPEIHPWRDS